MTHEFLESKEGIFESLRSNLVGRIVKLTNFTDRSFNYVWTQAFAEEVRELQEFVAVSQITGFIDYTGGPIDEDDLGELGYEGLITTERVNELMDENYLDEYVKIVGLTRNTGSPATGTVTFDTQNPETIIQAGTRVTTAPEADGTTTDFLTTERAESESGSISVSNVPIESIGSGEEFNVPANKITRITNPPVGVTGVANPESTTGGEDRETNDELRGRAKRAVPSAGEGGTEDGIKAFIRNNVEAVQQNDIIIDEFTDEKPPFVDVIVDGGLDSAVTDAIEFSRPTGIRHNLVRPQVVQLGVSLDPVGTDIDTNNVDGTITDFLLELGIGEEFFEDQFIREVMESDDDIINIGFLDTSIERVTNETFEYVTTIETALAEDGGSFTDETSEANDVASNDVTLLPAAPSVGDAYYFGKETIFSEIEIDITTVGTGTWDIVWEYHDGSGWELLNATDETSDFQQQGTNSVKWDIPSDWSSTTIDDSAGQYFVRARLDSLTSLNTQPLAQSIDVTGPGYRLDYTFEDSNGSVTVEGDSGDTHSLNTDFVIVDNSTDGRPETLVWKDGSTPDEGENFSVDYDVTVIGETKNSQKHETNLVRDESFIFTEGREDSRTYDNNKDVYEMSTVPFESTVSVTDENNTTFTEDTDWQLTAPQEYATTDTITFAAGTTDYSLSSDIEIDFVAVHDDDDNIYIRGTDYTTVDSDGDGFDDTISWDINSSVPADQTDFVVAYDAHPRGIRWDTNNSTPPEDDDFTITYDQAMYETEHEIVETPSGKARDASGDVYTENTEYTLVDSTRDGEDDALLFTQNPASLGPGEEFFLTYFNEGDINFGDREKADPGTITIGTSSGN